MVVVVVVVAVVVVAVVASVATMLETAPVVEEDGGDAVVVNLNGELPPRPFSWN